MCANSICQIPPKYLDCFYIDCTFQALTSASVLAWSPSWMILVSYFTSFPDALNDLMEDIKDSLLSCMILVSGCNSL